MNKPNASSDDDNELQNDQASMRNDAQSDTLGGSTTTPMSTASLVGSRLAGYLILSRLGRGGMADVYAARDMNLERDVAIKVLRADLARDRDYISRFRREAKAAAKLNHPNIVQIYEVGESAGRHYIAQELINGCNLRESLEREGAFDPDQAYETLVGVAAALDAASSQGITHRDIKPENVMRSVEGAIKVADFGLARLGNEGDGSRADLTQAGLTLGTPRYMSPEQVQGRPVDPRSDLYSLGVMMYHLLAGRPPFESDDPLALAFAHVNETPPPFDRARGDDKVPEWLVAIVSKLMRKDPAQRFQSAGELLTALTGDDSGQHVMASRMAGAATATARLQRAADQERLFAARRRRKWVMLSLLPIACGCLGVAVATQFRHIRDNNVATLLRPDPPTKAETVERQYWLAIQRDDVSHWTAVSQYFPAEESAVNRTYATKSILQLSRLLLEQGQPREAERVLLGLLDNPAIDRKYQLIAWARRAEAADAIGDEGKLAEAKRQVQALYVKLKSDYPDAIELFDEVVPLQAQRTMGISSGVET